MIIARKYEWLGHLYDRDPGARAAIDEACERNQVSESEKKEMLVFNHFRIAEQMDLGYGVPNQFYTELMDAFEGLDQKEPYDNRLTFNDVTDVEYEVNRKGTAIRLMLYSRHHDGPDALVAVVDVGEKRSEAAAVAGTPSAVRLTVP